MLREGVPHVTPLGITTQINIKWSKFQYLFAWLNPLHVVYRNKAALNHPSLMQVHTR